MFPHRTSNESHYGWDASLKISGTRQNHILYIYVNLMAGAIKSLERLIGNELIDFLYNDFSSVFFKFKGKRLLTLLMIHLIFSSVFFYITIYILPEGITKIYLILFFISLSVPISIWRFKQLRKNILGNTYIYKKFSSRIKLPIFIIFAILLFCFAKYCYYSKNDILFNLVISPPLYSFFISTLVLVFWLINYESKVGPVFIKEVEQDEKGK